MSGAGSFIERRPVALVMPSLDDPAALLLIASLLSLRDLCRFAQAGPPCRHAARGVCPSKLVLNSRTADWFGGPKTVPSLARLVEIHLTACARSVTIMPFAHWLGTADLPSLRAVTVERDLWGVSIRALCPAACPPCSFITCAAFFPCRTCPCKAPSVSSQPA